MRMSMDFLFLGFVAAFAAWVARAPADPPARATYLCAPIAGVGDMAARLESAMRGDDHINPPTRAWRPDPARACARIVERLVPGTDP
jgi:hypothetical protein